MGLVKRSKSKSGTQRTVAHGIYGGGMLMKSSKRAQLSARTFAKGDGVGGWSGRCLRRRVQADIQAC